MSETTITTYAVGLTLNASAYAKGSQLARGETAMLTRELRAAQTPAEKYGRELDIIERAFKATLIDAAQYNRLLEAQKQKLDAAAAAAAKYAAATKTTGKAGGGRLGEASDISHQIASGLGLSFGVAMVASSMKEMATQSIMLATNLQQARVQFGVLTGDTDRGDLLVTQMRQLSQASGLSFTGLQQAGRTLLSFGTSSQQVIPALRAIGEITMGDTERLKSMSLAYAQMTAAGRLLGQDLRQMVDAGFNPLQQISKDTGKSLIDLKKDMENGAISSKMVAEAFQHATQEGGQFFGLIEANKGTLAGQWRQLQNEFEMGLTEAGSRSSSTVGVFVEVLRQQVALLREDTDTLAKIEQARETRNRKGGFNRDELANSAKLFKERSEAMSPYEIEKKRLEDMMSLASPEQKKKISQNLFDLKADEERHQKQLAQAEEYDKARKEMEKAYTEGIIEEERQVAETVAKLKEEQLRKDEHDRITSKQAEIEFIQGRIKEGEQASKNIDRLGLAPAASRGSAEAYKIITQAGLQRDKELLKKSDKQIAELQRLNTELARATEALEDMKEVQVGRIR